MTCFFQCWSLCHTTLRHNEIGVSCEEGGCLSCHVCCVWMSNKKVVLCCSSLRLGHHWHCLVWGRLGLLSGSPHLDLTLTQPCLVDHRLHFPSLEYTDCVTPSAGARAGNSTRHSPTTSTWEQHGWTKVFSNLNNRLHGNDERVTGRQKWVIARSVCGLARVTAASIWGDEAKLPAEWLTPWWLHGPLGKAFCHGLSLEIANSHPCMLCVLCRPCEGA